MAFNQQLLMHNMTVKGKRLTAGLEMLVKSVENGEDVTGFPYHYALGCLGGDSITRKLMKTKWLPKVIDTLVANNLMKTEKGEKLKAEWKEKFVPEEDPSSVDAKSVRVPVDAESIPRQKEDGSVLVGRDQKIASTGERTDGDESVETTRISFVYDMKTKVCDYKDSVPKAMLGLFYDLCDSRSVTGYFPKTIEYRGAEWVRCPDEVTNDANKTIVSYQISL